MSTNKDPLSVEIYYDTYPKPKLIRSTNEETYISKSSKDQFSIHDINSPKIIPINDNIINDNTIDDINSPNITPINDNIINDNNEHNAIIISNEPSEVIKKTSNIQYIFGVCSILSCLIIGIVCIVIALQKNQPSDKHMIYLEGDIIYLFYLGVAIVFCICFCISASVCVHCCDICLVLN
tara:strand:+ start:75 stop:614 length:540 start_codon:yes stop_codon:yes gene_type:complete